MQRSVTSLNLAHPFDLLVNGTHDWYTFLSIYTYRLALPL